MFSGYQKAVPRGVSALLLTLAFAPAACAGSLPSPRRSRFGCEPKSATKYSWPVWSKDASTAAKIELALAKALAFASP